MNNPFLDYLKLLGQIDTELEHLTTLAQDKTAAVRASDLIALDAVIKQEQAASLAFRGLEQKQAALLKSTGLKGVPLTDIPEHFPPKMRGEAREVVEHLRTQYRNYCKRADTARSLLESGLLQIDKFLAQAEAVSVEGPGYQQSEPELPTPMKTDFRA